MKKHTIFLLLIALLIIPLSVQAVTVLNSKLDTTMKAGSSTVFNMVLTPDKGEDRVIFERIEASGDQCANWIKVNKTNMDFTKSTPVSALITVPKDAVNGLHKCDLTFTTPKNGMIQIAIGVPIAINVRDGINPTPTPKIVKIQAKEPAIVNTTTTATRTTVKPIITTIKPTEQAPAPDYAPDVSFSLLFAVSLIVIGVMGVFIALMMWWKK